MWDKQIEFEKARMNEMRAHAESERIIREAKSHRNGLVTSTRQAIGRGLIVIGKNLSDE